jgi:hypothetical protein
MASPLELFCMNDFCSTLYLIFLHYISQQEPGWRSRHSDWLRAGRPRGRSSSPGRVKNFHFSASSRPVVGSTQPSVEWVRGRALSPGEADGA